MFNYIKQYYQMGLYQASDLNAFVTSGMITTDELNSLIRTTFSADAAASESIAATSGTANVTPTA